MYGNKFYIFDSLPMHCITAATNALFFINLLIYYVSYTVKYCYKDHLKLRPLSLLRPLVSVSKCSFQCLINETCSLLRPLSTSTIGGLISLTSLYLFICFICFFLYFREKMGLLSNPKSRQKIIGAVTKYNNILSAACYVVGVIWFIALAYPPLNAKTYFSENALLPGKTTICCLNTAVHVLTLNLLNFIKGILQF